MFPFSFFFLKYDLFDLLMNVCDYENQIEKSPQKVGSICILIIKNLLVIENMKTISLLWPISAILKMETGFECSSYV